MMIIGSVGIFTVRIAPNCGSPADFTVAPPLALRSSENLQVIEKEQK
jgi:hypothetical protein